MPPPVLDTPLLLPMPRVLRLTGGRVDSGAVVPVEIVTAGWAQDPAAAGFAGHAQGYALSVRVERDGTARIEVRAGTAEGLGLAAATFSQLVAQYGDSLPCLEIHDAPSFLTRGVMLDVSRDRVPTMEELCRTVDVLALLKFNHLQLYTEHTFAYRDHREVWEGWSPITAAEIGVLDGYCRARGIALVANQNCFGHLAAWLKRPAYGHLAETHGDWVFDVWARSGPFSLCPTDPASEKFVAGLLGELLPNFSTGLVNIGCDETFDVGFGRSKAETEKRGRAAVYAEFVTKIAAIARGLGKRPMFWADIALSHPESLAALPADLIALAWGYEADCDFDAWCTALKKRGDGLGGSGGLETWVCPGTSSWRSITGRTTERAGNINGAARAGARHGAAGFLVCDWGDTGHQQQWPVAMQAIAHAAQAAWNADAPNPDLRAVSLHGHGDATLSVAPWLEMLGDADLSVRQVALPLSRPGVEGRLRNQSAIFIDMHTAIGEGLEVGSLELWRGALKNLDDAAQTLPMGLGVVLDGELRFTLDMARFAARRAVARREAGGMTARARGELRDQLDGLTSELRRLWLARSRPGGLEHSCGFLEKVRGELL